MRPTELTLDVMETDGQHGSIAIRVQIRVQIEGGTFSTRDPGLSDADRRAPADGCSGPAVSPSD
jgi:hypothetical protein